IWLQEVYFRARRPFWMMFWGGVFERHPRLKFVFTEQGVEFIPELLADMNSRFTPGARRPQKFMEHYILFFGEPRDLTLNPYDVWKGQGWAGGFAWEWEIEHRHEVGIDKIMWGSDYPHPEGTWPHTKERLRQAFAGVPAREVRLMVGENALQCY